MEAHELTRGAVAAQLPVAHLQQVANLIDFQYRHSAKHVAMPFHMGDIFAYLPDDFEDLFRTFHSDVQVIAAKMPQGNGKIV